MNTCAKLFIDNLNSKDLHFSVEEKEGGKTIVQIPFDNRNHRFVFTGDNGEYLSMYTLFESVPQDNFADALIVCNQLNAKYKWLKFYIDEDFDLMIDDDAILDPSNAADEAFELLYRRVNLLKEVKPTLMKAIYG